MSKLIIQNQRLIQKIIVTFIFDSQGLFTSIRYCPRILRTFILLFYALTQSKAEEPNY